MMPEPGPLREAYIAGATAEARHREAPREAARPEVAQLLEYLEATVEHRRDVTVGQLLTGALYVFGSDLARRHRRAIRRVLRGGRP